MKKVISVLLTVVMMAGVLSGSAWAYRDGTKSTLESGRDEFAQLA